MSRPTLGGMKTIESTGEAWDADVDDNFQDVKSVVEDNPIPIKYYATEGSLPAANQYDYCVAIIVNYNATGNLAIAVSDGTNWKYWTPPDA